MMGRWAEIRLQRRGSAAAPGKVAEVIALLDRQLQLQADQGSRYLVGGVDGRRHLLGNHEHVYH